MNIEEFCIRTQQLVDDAGAFGFNITVTQKPLMPPAMGHHETVVDVWPARHKPEVKLEPSDAAKAGVNAMSAWPYKVPAPALPIETIRPYTDALRRAMETVDVPLAYRRALFDHFCNECNDPAELSFQARVRPWMLACFGAEISSDTKERNHRFLEEALELVQAAGATQHEAHQLVEYVYGRPAGEKSQEVGGVMVTLAALCLAQGLDMHEAAETELARIWTKVEQIRAKQAAKPKHSPLPVADPSSEPLNSDTLWQLAQDECKAFESNGEGRYDEEGMHFRNRAALLRFAALVIDRSDAERTASPFAPSSTQAEPLSEAKVRSLWKSTFSTDNPFCPVDFKSFTKAARATEHAHLIGLATQPAAQAKGGA